MSRAAIAVSLRVLVPAALVLGLASAVSAEEPQASPSSSTGSSTLLGAAGDSATTPGTASPQPEAPTDGSLVGRLNGTRWSIELQPMYSDRPNEPLNDTLRFLNGKMTSDRLDAQGFSDAVVTVSPGKNGVVTWEAKQLSQQQGIVFWHGELDHTAMRGTLSKQPLEGDSEDDIFVGRPVDLAALQPPAAAPTVVPPPPSTYSTPAAPEQTTLPVTVPSAEQPPATSQQNR